MGNNKTSGFESSSYRSKRYSLIKVGVVRACKNGYYTRVGQLSCNFVIHAVMDSMRKMQGQLLKTSSSQLTGKCGKLR